MNLIARFEKTKTCWILIILTILFFILRFPSVIEPYWYGDEAIYEVIGQSMDHGKLLYRDVWDNKPPLLYTVYALSLGDQPTVKALSIIFGIISLITLFFLTEKLFHKIHLSILVTVLYVFLLGTPILEGNIANAEDFNLFPAILAGLLLYQLSSKKIPKPSFQNPTPFAAGLLLGIAFLFKVVAIFDLFAFIGFLFFAQLPHPISRSLVTTLLKKKSKYYFLTTQLILIILGFLLPFLCSLIYFALNNALGDYLSAAFSGNVDYVGWKNALFVIPQGLLITKGILLIGVLTFIFRKRKFIEKPTLFILLWLVFSLFNAFFSGRPYTHYAIVTLPSLCLFVGLVFSKVNRKIRQYMSIAILTITVILIVQFQPNFIKSFFYYENAFSFITGKESVEQYQTFFDTKTPRDYAVASFITSHTTTSQNIYLWGNDPQIYVLSHKLPINKYTVAYHVMQNNAFGQTQQSIDDKKPKYIIALKDAGPLPFALALYIMRYNTQETFIYERSY